MQTIAALHTITVSYVPGPDVDGFMAADCEAFATIGPAARLLPAMLGRPIDALADAPVAARPPCCRDAADVDGFAVTAVLLGRRTGAAVDDDDGSPVRSTRDGSDMAAPFLVVLLNFEAVSRSRPPPKNGIHVYTRIR